jgi:hypothetical protein
MTLYRIDNRCTTRSVNPADRTIDFLVQSTALASDKMIILARAAEQSMADYMKNPIVLPYHNRQLDNGQPVVIGKVTEFTINEEGLTERVQFAQTPLAEQWWELYRDGFMNMCSIGMDNLEKVYARGEIKRTLESEKISITPQELSNCLAVVTRYRQRELSLLPLGADPKALARAMDYNEVARTYYDLYKPKGGPPATKTPIPKPEANALEVQAQPVDLPPEFDLNLRGVIEHTDHGIANEAVRWDAVAEVAAATVDDLRVMCAWFDGDGTRKSDYKLPHHKQSNKQAVWRGVAAAMGVLNGSMGGLKGEAARHKDEIYTHLAAHYKEFDKPVPGAPKRAEQGMSEAAVMPELQNVNEVVVATDPWEAVTLAVRVVADKVERLAAILYPQPAETTVATDYAYTGVNLEIVPGPVEAVLEMLNRIGCNLDMLAETGLPASARQDKTGAVPVGQIETPAAPVLLNEQITWPLDQAAEILRRFVK